MGLAPRSPLSGSGTWMRSSLGPLPLIYGNSPESRRLSPLLWSNDSRDAWNQLAPGKEGQPWWSTNQAKGFPISRTPGGEVNEIKKQQRFEKKQRKREGRWRDIGSEKSRQRKTRCLWREAKSGWFSRGAPTWGPWPITRGKLILNTIFYEYENDTRNLLYGLEEIKKTDCIR